MKYKNLTLILWLLATITIQQIYTMTSLNIINPHDLVKETNVEILGLSPLATYDEIDNRYQQIKQHHRLFLIYNADLQKLNKYEQLDNTQKSRTKKPSIDSYAFEYVREISDAYNKLMYQKNNLMILSLPYNATHQDIEKKYQEFKTAYPDYFALYDIYADEYKKWKNDKTLPQPVIDNNIYHFIHSIQTAYNNLKKQILAYTQINEDGTRTRVINFMTQKIYKYKIQEQITYDFQNYDYQNKDFKAELKRILIKKVNIWNDHSVSETEYNNTGSTTISYDKTGKMTSIHNNTLYDTNNDTSPQFNDI